MVISWWHLSCVVMGLPAWHLVCLHVNCAFQVIASIQHAGRPFILYVARPAHAEASVGDADLFDAEDDAPEIRDPEWDNQ